MKHEWLGKVILLWNNLATQVLPTTGKHVVTLKTHWETKICSTWTLFSRSQLHVQSKSTKWFRDHFQNSLTQCPPKLGRSTVSDVPSDSSHWLNPVLLLVFVAQLRSDCIEFTTLTGSSFVVWSVKPLLPRCWVPAAPPLTQFPVTAPGKTAHSIQNLWVPTT